MDILRRYEIGYDVTISYIRDLSPDEEIKHSLWKVTMKIPIMSKPPIGKGNGSWARDNKEKSKLLAEELSETF